MVGFEQLNPSIKTITGADGGHQNPLYLVVFMEMCVENCVVLVRVFGEKHNPINSKRDRILHPAQRKVEISLPWGYPARMQHLDRYPWIFVPIFLFVGLMFWPVVLGGIITFVIMHPFEKKMGKVAYTLGAPILTLVIATIFTGLTGWIL